VLTKKLMIDSTQLGIHTCVLSPSLAMTAWLNFVASYFPFCAWYTANGLFAGGHIDAHKYRQKIMAPRNVPAYVTRPFFDQSMLVINI
jgi:hypothetical protein